MSATFFLVIFLLLYSTFGSALYAAMVFTGVPRVLSGGISSLWLRDLPPSISPRWASSPSRVWLSGPSCPPGSPRQRAPLPFIGSAEAPAPRFYELPTTRRRRTLVPVSRKVGMVVAILFALVVQVGYAMPTSAATRAMAARCCANHCPGSSRSCNDCCAWSQIPPDLARVVSADISSDPRVVAVVPTPPPTALAPVPTSPCLLSLHAGTSGPPLFLALRSLRL